MRAGHLRRSPAAAGGIGLAVASAATFGLSGSFAKALIDAGWSATGTVLVRLGGAAVVIGVLLAVTRPGVIAAVRRDLPGLLVYGALAMAGVQVAFFNAVRYLAVPVALLLEYAGPVLVIAWVWLVRRQPPGRRTLVGGAIAICGLVLVVQVWSVDGVSGPGLAWGFAAACCQAVYFLKPDEPSGDGHFLKPGGAGVRTEPVVLAGVGMVVGSAVVVVLGLLGLLPLDVDPGAVGVRLAGVDLGWPATAALLVLVSTVFAYLTGIGAVQRIGSSRSSLIGLLEVVSSAIAAWVLLGEVPAPVQAVGGALILAGVALTQASPRPARG